LLLSPNLRIVNANDAYIAVTITRRSDLIGSDLFDAFPDNPDHREANAVTNLRASLTRVLDEAQTDRMAIQRYDIRDPMACIFEEQWWKPHNIPVFADEGRIGLILRHVEDVTADRLDRNGSIARSSSMLRSGE
jgi:PAS domain-containing protein